MKLPAWTISGDLAAGRSGHTATLLGDGTVLVAGGGGKKGNGEFTILDGCEVYDPAIPRHQQVGVDRRIAGSADRPCRDSAAGWESSHCGRTFRSERAEQTRCRTVRSDHWPPTTSTLPFPSRVAVCSTRTVLGSPVALHVPVTGSYNSAPSAMNGPNVLPPTTRTVPSGNSVAVCAALPLLRDRSPVVVHFSVDGSYNSEVGIRSPKSPASPPATRTDPLLKSVAVCALRAPCRLAAGLDLRLRRALYILLALDTLPLCSRTEGSWSPEGSRTS